MHTNPDVLTLLALGENAGDASDQAHIRQCRMCTAELDELIRVVQTARTVDPDDVPVDPGPQVWQSILAEINQSPATAFASVRSTSTSPVPRVGAPRRALTYVLVAAVALVAGLGLGLGISRVNQINQAASSITHLNALPSYPGAGGTARYQRNSDGSRDLVVSVMLPQATDGSLEVWLSDDQSESMTSMGYLTDGKGTFRVPATMDVTAAPVLDVSLEPAADADPDHHSGASVVRGRMIR